MKNLSAVILIAILFISHSFVYGQSRPLYEKQVKHYNSMKSTGTVIVVAGGVLTAIGVGLVATADWKTTNTATSSNATTTDETGIMGIACLVVGVPLTVTGIVVALVGAKNAKHYQRALDGMALNVKCTPQYAAVSYVYKF